jgi:hypothetical protein
MKTNCKPGCPAQRAHARATRWRVPALLFLLVAVPFGTACGTVRTVYPIPQAPYPNIQDAIDASGNGDIVELANGTFHGTGNCNLRYGGRAITIRSQSGDPSLCAIGEHSSHHDDKRGFIFAAVDGPGAVLTGVTVMNGFHQDRGGGIACAGSPTITTCQFCYNDTHGDGAAVYL